MENSQSLSVRVTTLSNSIDTGKALITALLLASQKVTDAKSALEESHAKYKETTAMLNGATDEEANWMGVVATIAKSTMETDEVYLKMCQTSLDRIMLQMQSVTDNLHMGL